jgi:hypothetical protein
VPKEPRRGQVIDLMRRSRRRSSTAVSQPRSQTRPRRNPPFAAARGAARSARAHGTPGGVTAAHGQQEIRRSYLTGTASGEPITVRRFAWLNRRPAFAHGRAVERETPRNCTRSDCRDDQPHDRREDLSEGLAPRQG